VLDVIDSVRVLGFRRLSVYSPARQFAAAPFRSAFLDRAPAELEITVPLYGVTAPVHEAVTGLPGSHAQVLAAIDALSAADRPVDLRLSTVIVKQNVHQLPELLRFAAARRLSLDARVPYPMRQTVRDPYADSALRESEIVRRFVDATRQLEPREILDGGRDSGPRRAPPVSAVPGRAAGRTAAVRRARDRPQARAARDAVPLRQVRPCR
jgi:hypothetical protein